MAHILTFQSVKPDIDETAFIADTATIIGRAKLHEGVSIWFNAVLRGDENQITVGKYTNIQDNVMVHPDADQPLTIGNYVLIGHNAIIHGASIGDGCLIGMGSIIQSYTDIGENCIIGAGSLVTQHKKIPANSLVYGNPARVIRTATDE